MGKDQGKATKVIIFGELGKVKVRLKKTSFRGAITGRVYVWYKDDMAVWMDQRDYDAAFPVEQKEDENGTTIDNP